MTDINIHDTLIAMSDEVMSDDEILAELFPLVVQGASTEFDSMLPELYRADGVSENDSDRVEIVADQLVEWLDTNHAKWMFLDYLERCGRRLGVD